MSTIEHRLAGTGSATEDSRTDAAARRLGLVFWIVRDLPA